MKVMASMLQTVMKWFSASLKVQITQLAALLGEQIDI